MRSRRTEFLRGVRATIPLIVGAIPFGIIFGALSITTGLSVGQTMGLSAILFAGSAQFIGVGLIGQGLAPGIIILTTFMVNLRHALYSATLAPYVRHLGQKWLLPLGFALTDETFVVVATDFQRAPDRVYRHYFWLGSAVALYLNWQLFTLIGIVAGRQIADPQSWGLDFAMIVTFIGMVVPLVRNRPMVASVLAAGIVAVLANGLPNKLGLMLAAIVGILVGVLAELRWPVEERIELPAEEAAA